MGQLIGVSVQALAHAWSLLPRAGEIVGSAADDLAMFSSVSGDLARELGVEQQFVEIAGELISEGAPPRAARAAAFWASRRFYAIDPRIARELDGPHPDELAADELALAADAEERETAKYLAETYPAECAKRGESAESNPAWRAAMGKAKILESVDRDRLVAAHAEATSAAVDAPSAPAQRLSDWSIEEIRNDYRRHMSGAERAMFNAELRRASPVEVAPSENAVRAAMQAVLDRRVRGAA